MIVLTVYQLFDVMFSFEPHMETISVYLHTFCLQHYDFHSLNATELSNIYL